MHNDDGLRWYLKQPPVLHSHSHPSVTTSNNDHDGISRTAIEHITNLSRIPTAAAAWLIRIFKHKHVDKTYIHIKHTLYHYTLQSPSLLSSLYMAYFSEVTPLYYYLFYVMLLTRTWLATCQAHFLLKTFHKPLPLKPYGKYLLPFTIHLNMNL